MAQQGISDVPSQRQRKCGWAKKHHSRTVTGTYQSHSSQAALMLPPEKKPRSPDLYLFACLVCFDFLYSISLNTIQ